MSNLRRLAQWIAENKQVGDVFTFERDGETCWSSVAIQKWDDNIMVYVDEILESEMIAENYLRDEVVVFDRIDSAIEYVSENTMASIEKLTPCKGQRIFDPGFT